MSSILLCNRMIRCFEREDGEDKMKALVAIDGSNQIEGIVQVLHAISPLEHLLLLHVIRVPELAYPGTGMSIGKEFSTRAEDALRAEGVRILDDVSSRLPADIGRLTKRIELGLPSELILSLADKEKMNSIVVGSRGLGMIREQVLGSVSHRVVSQAPCSTLVVKAGINRIQQVLLPIEHDEDAERAFSFLSAKPFRGQTRIRLLHVIPFAQPVLPIGALMPETLRKDLFAEGEKFTAEMASRLSALGYDTDTLVATGAPSSIIHEQAQTIKADLIMMGVQRGKALSRFFLGSVSHSVVHHSTCSVFLLR